MRSDDKHKAGVLLGQLDDVAEAVGRARLMLDAVRASWDSHEPKSWPELVHLKKMEHLVQVLENSSALAVVHTSQLMDTGWPLEDEDRGRC